MRLPSPGPSRNGRGASKGLVFDDGGDGAVKEMEAFVDFFVLYGEWGGNAHDAAGGAGANDVGSLAWVV